MEQRTQKRPTDGRRRQGKGNIGIILLLLILIIVVGYFVYINYILKKVSNNTTNTPNSNNQVQNTPNLDNIKVTKTSVDQKTKAVEEFAKEFDGKAEYDKEKNIIGINLKDSNILDGKKENTGKDTIQVNEIQEKFKKLIQDMGLRTCRNASTIRISRNRCSNSSNCKIRKSVMYVVWK